MGGEILTPVTGREGSYHTPTTMEAATKWRLLVSGFLKQLHALLHCKNLIQASHFIFLVWKEKNNPREAKRGSASVMVDVVKRGLYSFPLILNEESNVLMWEGS